MTQQKLVQIKLIDEVNCILYGLEPSHVNFFNKKYSMHVPDYFFSPLYKLGKWDGTIKFFFKTGKTFINLLPEIVPIIKSFGYKIQLNDQRHAPSAFPQIVDKDYFKHIIEPDSGQPIELRDYQIDGVNSLLAAGNGIVIAGTGAGKAQPLTANVLTTNGWKRMGEITIGETVVTPKGTFSKVIGVFPQGKKKIYEIEFHDGAKTQCCAEHLWETRFPKQLHKAWTEKKIVSTTEIIEFLERKESGLHTPGNISVPLCKPIEFTKKNVPIDPYSLGALIGDGCITTKTPLFSNKDVFVLERVKNYLLSLNLNMTFVESSVCDYRISNATRAKMSFPPTKNPLSEKLQMLDLYGCQSNNKFVPTIYKNGSIKQRYEILHGLLDTDGTVDARGNVSFTTVSKKLAQDVQEIVWSLGGICTISSRTSKYTYLNETKEGQLAYTCFIRVTSPQTLFYTPNKRNRCREQYADGRVELTRRVKSVSFVKEEEAQCILINDPDHLYLTDNFIVTHNTLINGALVDCYGKQGLKTITIVPSQDLILQTKNYFTMLELDVGEYSGDCKDIDHTHVVSTWQSLQNNPSILAQFQVFVVDECHGAKGKVLNELLNDAGKHISHRFGLTGTLPKHETDALMVRVVIGDVRYEIPAHKLIAQDYLAKLHINIYQLEEDLTKQYQEFVDENPIEHVTYQKFKDSYFPEYSAEKRYLQSNKQRLNWIADLIMTKRDMRKGNIFCLVSNISFGKKLAKLIPDAVFVYGKDDKKTRKQVYDLFKDNNDVVVIATVNIASTGLDIKRIFNLIYIDVGKSFIRVIQTIGRGLRKAPDKDFVDVTDVCSDLKYARNHVRERIKFYREAQYPYKKTVVKYE